MAESAQLPLGEIERLMAAIQEGNRKNAAELLGVKERELTPTVRLVVSALLEKLTDIRQDLSHEREKVRALEQAVEVDPLTGVANRLGLERKLRWAAEMRRRYGHALSIVFIDLNGLKAINDAHGHAAGDEAIMRLAEVLRKNLRASDYIARLGGDEFAVLMFQAQLAQAQEKARTLKATLAKETLIWEGVELPLRAAFGTVELAQGQTPEEALDAADKAMYVDKQSDKRASASA